MGVKGLYRVAGMLVTVFSCVPRLGSGRVRILLFAMVLVGVGKPQNAKPSPAGSAGEGFAFGVCWTKSLPDASFLPPC